MHIAALRGPYSCDFLCSKIAFDSDSEKTIVFALFTVCNLQAFQNVTMYQH